MVNDELRLMYWDVYAQKVAEETRKERVWWWWLALGLRIVLVPGKLNLGNIRLWEKIRK